MCFVVKVLLSEFPAASEVCITGFDPISRICPVGSRILSASSRSLAPTSDIHVTAS